MPRKSGVSLDHNRLVSCHVGLPYSIIQIVEELAKEEARGEQSRILRKLVLEALRSRELIK